MIMGLRCVFIVVAGSCSDCWWEFFVCRELFHCSQDNFVSQFTPKNTQKWLSKKNQILTKLNVRCAFYANRCISIGHHPFTSLSNLPYPRVTKRRMAPSPRPPVGHRRAHTGGRFPNLDLSSSPSCSSAKPPRALRLALSSVSAFPSISFRQWPLASPVAGRSRLSSPAQSSADPGEVVSYLTQFWWLVMHWFWFLLALLEGNAPSFLPEFPDKLKSIRAMHSYLCLIWCVQLILGSICWFGFSGHVEH
jgi:hypothetical protein